MTQMVIVFSLIPFFLLGGVDQNMQAADRAGIGAQSVASKTEPERVVVQHILVAFKGTVPDDKVTRTRQEAETLAKELFDRAQARENFDALVRAYTDDQHPGIYRMANTGITPDTENNEYSREKMVKAFGDVSFSLRVGEVGMALYDPAASKYGWHIIKRLK